jgi:hypothetical protein
MASSLAGEMLVVEHERLFGVSHICSTVGQGKAFRLNEKAPENRASKCGLIGICPSSLK